MNLDIFGEEFVFLFVSGNFDSNSNSKSFFFYGFMNIFQNFNNLRHDDNLFNYLFKDEWNLNQFFLVGDDFDWNIDDPVNNLQNLFDMVDISDGFFELFKDNSFFNNLFYFLNSFIFVSQFNNFFVLLNNLFNSFHNNRHFDDLFNDVLNVLVNVDKLRNNFFYLDDLWNFNNFLFNSFYFVDLRNNDGSVDNLFNNLFSCHDFSTDIMNRHNLFNKSIYFFNFSSDIGNFLYYLFDFSVINNSLFNFNDFDWLGLDSVLNNDLFHDCWNLDDFLNSFVHRNHLFDNSVDWNRNLDWDNDLLLDFNNLGNFDLVVNNLFNRNISGNFSDSFNNSFNNDFMRNNLLFVGVDFN